MGILAVPGVSSVTDEIKQRVDLVELIGRTVQLKRAGTYFKGLCPFHTEKTPSFYVRPDRGTWHCFGCDRGGTAFDWLMEREHLEFGEALIQLAQQTGTELPTRRQPEVEEQHQRLLTILQRAQTYYQGLFWGATAAAARAYMDRRGLNRETLEQFGIGYAPTSNGLIRYLHNEGFTNEQELQAAGVIGTSDDGRNYDFFRDRVLFPIRDTQGRTIAFGGRSLEESAVPKYLNSRDTLLFHKQETLFAYDQARKTVAQERQVVIVEGYMDALMAHQHGYRNVVATLGTAVTEQHLRVLRRQVDDIILALDPDAAGQAATERALRLADDYLRTDVTRVVGPDRRRQQLIASRAVQLRVLTLPDGKDPDELVRSDPLSWPTLVHSAEPVIEFVLRRVPTRHDLESPAGRAAAAEEITDVLLGISDPVKQGYYANLAEEELKSRFPLAIDEDPRGGYYNVHRLLARKQQRGASRPTAAPPPPTSQVQGDNDDDYLLALLMRLRELPDQPALPERELKFSRPESRAVYRALDAELAPELEPFAERARSWLPLVEQLPTDRLLQRIDEMQLNIERAQLARRQREINEILTSGSAESDISEWAQQLIAIARRIDEIDRELPPERERAAIR